MDEKSAVSYAEAIEFMNDIYRFFDLKNELIIKSIQFFLDALYKRKIMPIEFIDWENFFFYIESQMRFLPLYLQYNFLFSILTQTSYFSLPKKIEISRLLSEEQLVFLYLSNLNIALNEKLHLIFSSFKEGLNFDKLIKKLIDFDGPTIILIKHKDSNIFGTFNSIKWEDNKDGFQGNKDCYLFDMKPNFKNYFPKKWNKKDENHYYAYLNYKNDELPKGIGFGVNFKTDLFRIWIDYDIANGSYILAEDDIYENGNIINDEDLKANKLLKKILK